MQLSKVGAAALTACAVTTVNAIHEATTPVERVVGLLAGLSTKLKTDYEAEKNLFEKYVCWHKSIVESKTASNTAAQTRIDSLKAYIADIEAGKFEFTSERVELQKQIDDLKHDLSTAKDLRETENADYLAAKEEMDAAVAALEKAIARLQAGTGLSMLEKPSPVTYDDRQSFEQAVKLGRSKLSRADAVFLERMLVGEVPEVDWKKLNRKATFKMKYEAQSQRIIDTLKGMKAMFEENLGEAADKETAAQGAYDKLKGSKEVMLGDAEQALITMAAENGARALTKSEAQEEVDALEKQVQADKQFIIDSNTAIDAKKVEWAERERLRQMEITAISEAISVLRDEEARDTFKKSYKSQGYTFVQVAQQQQKRMSSTVHTLKKLAAVSNDPRLALLVASFSNKDAAFAEVITHIDQMVTDLQAEEASDLKTKEDCESTRAAKTRVAKETSVAIDDLSEQIVRHESKVEEITAQIKEQEEMIEKTNQTLIDITRQRKDENTQYIADKADDEKAVELIQKAIDVFDKLKTDMAGLQVAKRAVPARPQQAAHASHQMSLTAVKAAVKAHGVSRARASQPEVAVGEAPPPPPKTWESGSTYGGASGETAGINAILAMLRDDVKADIASADKAETEAVTEYTKEKGELEATLKAAQDAIDSYVIERTTETQAVLDKNTARGLKHGELQSTMDAIKALEPGCDFFLINYGLRASNRQIEIDGLTKAKAILKGANFE